MNDDDQLPPPDEDDPPDAAEVAALARENITLALRALARVAENSNDPKIAEAAQRELEAALVRLKAIVEHPSTTLAVRSDLERELRKFRHS